MTSEEKIEQALADLEDMAVQAAPEDLLRGAVDRECGPLVLADLLAHELVASHRLMQRIAAATHGILHCSAPADDVDEASAAPAGANPAAELAAARLAGVAGRLMEQVRLGILVLRRLRPDLPEDEEGVWLALRWQDDRCSPRNSRAASPPPRPPAPNGIRPRPRLRARRRGRRSRPAAWSGRGWRLAPE
jgi:hypothetical protein